MILRLWIEAHHVEIPILLARREEREARRLFPQEVLAALVHDTAAPPWKDALFHRPRAGLAVDPSILPNARELPSDELGQALRARFGMIGPNIARSVCQWPDWHYPPHLVKLNSWWLPAGTARYPQGLFLIPADMIDRADLPNAERVIFHASVTRDQGIIPEWSLVLPCFVTRLVKQGRLAVAALAGAGRELQSRWVQGPITNWGEAVARLAGVGATLNVTPRWQMPLSEDATRGLWNAALAVEAVCINHGVLPITLDGQTIVGTPWDAAAYQFLWGRAANIYEDVLRPSRIGGLRVAFPVGRNKVPSPRDEWFTLSVEADARRGPFLPAVEALWAEGNPPQNRPTLEKMAAWLVKLVQMIPHGWTGEVIPGAPQSETPVYDWLLVSFTAHDLRVIQRPFSAYNLPLEWLHAGPPQEVATSSSTSSTTGPPCSGTCRWNWSPGENNWVLLESDCSEGCFCVGPQECPGDGETVTPCGGEAIDPCTTTSTTTSTTTTTQEPPPCAGSCTYRYNAQSGRWELVESGCDPADCLCDPSGLDCDHPDGSLVVRNCVRNPGGSWPICTTTTAEPCQGWCRWVWDPLGKRWVLAHRGCAQGPWCDCSPPAFCGKTAADCAYTDCSIAPVAPEPECGQPKPPTTSSSTSSTSSTSPYPVCTGECRWRWFLGSWHAEFEQSPCTWPCRCSPPSQSGQSECDVWTSPCLPPPEVSTSTTAEGCGGQCEFFYVDESLPVAGFHLGWNRINGDRVKCSGPPDCRCAAPTEPGYPCEIRYVPCLTGGDIPPPTTPSGPTCDGYCLWKYDSATQTWSLHTSYCPAECPCSQPNQPPRHGADCELVRSPCGPAPTSSTSSTSSTSTSSTSSTSTTTTSTTTTTPAPCTGQCSWMCLGGVWSLLASTCTESCQGCSPPQGGCGDGDLANTGCIPAPTTTRDPSKCYGTCEIRCLCANSDCTRGVWGIASSSCSGEGCICTSDQIGKPCDPRLQVILSGMCERGPTTSSTTSSTSTSTTTSTTTTTTSAPPSSTEDPGSTTTTTSGGGSSTSTTGTPCSACACWWSWDDEYGWMLEGTCADNGCPGCSCNPPSGAGSYQGEWRSMPCF